MTVYLRFSILLLIKVTFTAGLSKTTFTLYTSTPQMNWATTVTFCRDQSQELFRVMSQAEQDFLKSLGQSDGPWYNQNTGNYWSSLHDPDAQNSPGVGYQWQLLDQSSCLAMTAGSWSDWTQNEPLNAATSACIKMEWSNSEGYKWRSEQCTSYLTKVICRKSGGNCSFVTHSGKVITSALRTLSLSDETSSACQQTCSGTSAFQLDCWAAAWKPSTGQCTLYLSDGPFQSADLGNSGDAETELYVLQCLESGLIQIPTTPSQLASGYNPTCTANGAGGASGGGGSSSAAVVTPTSERHMQLLTYFPNTVTRPVAKAACTALSAQSTMVMPKDQWTSVKVRQFLSSMDTPSTVWLGVRGNSTNDVTWVDGSDAIWPEGDTATPSATMQCVIGTAVDDVKLQWDSAKCRTDESAFMCQTPNTGSCTYQQRINKIMASDWVQSFTTVDDCDSYCDTHLFNDQECQAFSYVNGASQSNCFLAYEESTLFDTDNSDFHARTCFQYATYDNSSDAVNAVLYSTSSATTSSNTATLGNTATVSSSAETVTTNLASTMTPENDITVTSQQVSTTETDPADSTTLVNGAASSTLNEATSSLGENTTPVNSATNSATTEVITSSGATSPLGENTTPVNSETNSAMTVVTSSGATSSLGENTTPVNSATNSAMTVVTSSGATTQVDSATASTMTEAPSSPGENTTPVRSAVTEATSSLPLETTAETVSSTTDNTEAETTTATTTETTTAVTNTAELPETGQTTAVEGTTSETNGVTGSANDQQAATSNKKLCPCTRCVHRSSLSTNDTDHDAIVAQIVDSLTIDKKTTSQRRRKYESATDSRKSAQTIGSFGIACLVVVFSLIVVVDLCGLFCRMAGPK
ncbi:serine-rich adhesin for platelets-like [Littorina saxatilis]|uniref:serine-rich adhesin for platelets-like n=1 Tax=Littorina saxatilis TaxID=31220 RepID=UPI0038B679A2